MNPKFNTLPINKNKILKEEDINISITDEHNEQELTSMCETGKSLGIISVMNLPHLTISTTNKTKTHSKKQYDSIYNKDNFSTYTNFNNVRNNTSMIKDEVYTEVRIINKFLFLKYSIENYYVFWNKKKLRKKRCISYIMKNLLNAQIW